MQGEGAAPAVSRNSAVKSQQASVWAVRLAVQDVETGAVARRNSLSFVVLRLPGGRSPSTCGAVGAEMGSVLLPSDVPRLRPRC